VEQGDELAELRADGVWRQDVARNKAAHRLTLQRVGGVGEREVADQRPPVERIDGIGAELKVANRSGEIDIAI
jgi:hypothetical protein